jgi:23S rRNA pseudouridine1911/1915/1917 synthase
MTYDQLNIIYEDNHLLVVVKPQNVPSQADESGDADMLTLLKQYLADKYNKQGNVYLGLVHRLDRPTGGVMVFAKTSKAAGRLSESMRGGEFEKKYLTVVQGEPKEKNAILRNYLYKYSNLNIVKVVPAATQGALPAVLMYNHIATKSFETTDADGNTSVTTHSLLKVELGTGRSHQIRVQLAFIGNPLVGDSKYGTLKSKNPTPLALWAYELKFPHPVSKNPMVFRVYPDITQAPWNEFDIDSALRVTIRN